MKEKNEYYKELDNYYSKHLRVEAKNDQALFKAGGRKQKRKYPNKYR